MTVRQAHPGEERGGFGSYAEKVESAREFKRLETIPWRVVVDDLAGTTHRAYSREMADPTFLVDADGRIAFYNMWTHVPSLKRALDALLARDGRGVVSGGIDRAPHLFASFVDGYRGPRRGGRRGVLEYDLGGFGAGSLSFLGSKLKPWLASFALRAAPRNDPLEETK